MADFTSRKRATFISILRVALSSRLRASFASDSRAGGTADYLEDDEGNPVLIVDDNGEPILLSLGGLNRLTSRKRTTFVSQVRV